MRGQPENPLDLGIGRKVERPTEQADPWVKVKPGVWRNTQTGKTETRIPGNEAANQQPVEEDPLLIHDTGAALDWFRRRGLILDGYPGE
jgi:hypothetical protein